MEQGYADRLLTTVDGVRQCVRVCLHSETADVRQMTLFLNIAVCFVYIGSAWCALSTEIAFICKITVPISYARELL